MQKVKITLVVPERIAALVQHFVQHNLCGEGNPDFKDFLEMSEVENISEYISEMEIGIDHPDDESIKIASYGTDVYREVHDWFFNKKCYSYMDMVLDENLYSIVCLDEINVNPPQIVLDFIQSVKATDCSYFRFVNS